MPPQVFKLNAHLLPSLIDSLLNFLSQFDISGGDSSGSSEFVGNSVYAGNQLATQTSTVILNLLTNIMTIFETNSIGVFPPTEFEKVKLALNLVEATIVGTKSTPLISQPKLLSHSLAEVVVRWNPTISGVSKNTRQAIFVKTWYPIAGGNDGGSIGGGNGGSYSISSFLGIRQVLISLINAKYHLSKTDKNSENTISELVAMGVLFLAHPDHVVRRKFGKCLVKVFPTENFRKIFGDRFCEIFFQLIICMDAVVTGDLSNMGKKHEELSAIFLESILSVFRQQQITQNSQLQNVLQQRLQNFFVNCKYLISFTGVTNAVPVDTKDDAGNFFR